MEFQVNKLKFSPNYFSEAGKAAKLKATKQQALSMVKEATGAMLIDVIEAGNQKQAIIEATDLERVNAIINSLKVLLQKD